MIRPLGAREEVKTPEEEKPDALEGLQVADFSWVGVGPITTRYLADHGATVVRVESIRSPDLLRLSSPYAGRKPGINRSQFYANYNVNKLGLAANLKMPQGLDLARRLIAWADVVVENFMPGTAEALGIGYEDARIINPGVVYFSASLFGRGGPHSGLRGLGGHLTHVAGLTSMTGAAGGTPMSPYGPYTDYLAPRFGVAALLAALDYRRRTGMGQHLDLSQLESTVLCIAPEILATALTGAVPRPRGNKHEWAAPHDFYPCAGLDRWCAIAVFTNEEWAALRNVMGDPAWAASPDLATVHGRKQHEAQLDAALAEWTGTQEAHSLMLTLQAAGVAAGVVQTVEDLFADPQLSARGHFQRLDHAEMGEHANDADCFLMSVTPARYRTAAPLLGEHSELVLREILGMDDDQIVELIVAGVLE